MRDLMSGSTVRLVLPTQETVPWVEETLALVALPTLKASECTVAAEGPEVVASFAARSGCQVQIASKDKAGALAERNR